MDSNLRIIAAIILTMLAIACWFWIRPAHTSGGAGENFATKIERPD